VNSKRVILILGFAAWLFFAVAPALAHHSTAEYDMTALTSVKGTVTQFEWTNPHAYIHIDVKDDKATWWNGPPNSPALGCFPGLTGSATR
jgi:hypothetical protein